MPEKDWRGQRVLIIGAARQGLALARYLVLHGAEVILNDRRPEAVMQDAQESLADLNPLRRLTWVLGDHPLITLEGVDLVCPSGGVPLDMPLVAEAVRRGVPLSNDSQIFLEAVPCPVIGITGSAGKTTTTMLVGRMAQAASQTASGAGELEPGYRPRNVWVGGNIGAPLISEVDEMSPEDLAVMELSSFQLEIMTRSPQVAAILNITPNHLDRHGSMQAYTAAKKRILDFQTSQDAAVLSRDDPGAWSMRESVHGKLVTFGLNQQKPGQEDVFLDGEHVALQTGGQVTPIMERSAVELRGEHNLVNVLAACAIAAAANLPVSAMRAGVAGFEGAPHRLEFIRSWGGADWYNDSIATAPERAMAAIRSFDEPLILLAGGRDKNLPWEDFASLVSRRVDHLVVFGEAADKILAAMHQQEVQGSRTKIHRADGLKQAMEIAAQIVQPGYVVLLSPGGTSFDEFKDFEERGECFARWVKELP